MESEDCFPKNIKNSKKKKYFRNILEKIFLNHLSENRAQHSNLIKHHRL